MVRHRQGGSSDADNPGYGGSVQEARILTGVQGKRRWAHLAQLARLPRGVRSATVQDGNEVVDAAATIAFRTRAILGTNDAECHEITVSCSRGMWRSGDRVRTAAGATAGAA